MRIAVLGPSRHPVAQPFAGGQERFTADLTLGLRKLGHHVELYALPGSDERLADCLHPMPLLPPLSQIASADLQMPEPQFLHDQVVYLAAIRDLLCRSDIDAVLNESLHQLPLAMCAALPVPMVTTLHTPPFPWMEVGAWLAGSSGHFVAVSQALRRQWETVATSRVILNGVDPDAFPVGTGGDTLAWVGRMTPEKGADIAIHAARKAGRKLRLAGPVSDPNWFDAVIRPLLGNSVTYVGPLGGSELADFYGASAATLVTPRWEEPYCLVAAESQMCGTPVVGVRRGGLAEVVSKPGGVLVSAGSDLSGRLGEALCSTEARNRAIVAAHARRHLGIDRMIEDYERLLFELSDIDTRRCG
ncbi:glycosyltransferase [Mycobacterium sp. 236(2023)]|uniref:glycosyltransferase n=1 Tax=Mycobacterium sp. 236(2023) TaxID=3038163 RepID=UPI0024154054|nr:glycosyltransferase [Mycobacterium sp. 236(2023)]MDG4664848.1 glycosyltransferase [Mycobacterium sp. 236(2023)]